MRKWRESILFSNKMQFPREKGLMEQLEDCDIEKTPQCMLDLAFKFILYQQKEE